MLTSLDDTLALDGQAFTVRVTGENVRCTDQFKEAVMPKVDDSTGQPMPDAPDQDDDTRGGKVEGDPALEGASETGGSNVAERKQD